jgi:glyoxylase-like metal-dependent hydrolase (beta-lactamase superfamily II)
MRWPPSRGSQSGRSAPPAASAEPKGWPSHESHDLVVPRPLADRPARRAQAAEPPVYEVYAVRYATLRGFAVADLVQGADPERKLDIAMSVWVLKGPDGRTVLVDAGFYRPPYLGGKVADYTRPDRALKPLGITPEQVTDVVVTHMHWDHVDGVDLFPRARVWIQRDEFDYYTRDAQQPGGGRKDPAPGYILAMLELNRAGRVGLVDGDAREIIPGVTLYTGGRHTYASQYVGVNTRAGRVVIASDNVYLYENLDGRVPIAQTFDAAANLAAHHPGP